MAAGGTLTRGHVGKGTHERHRGSVDQNGAELVDRLTVGRLAREARFQVGQVGNLKSQFTTSKGEVGLIGSVSHAVERAARPYLVKPRAARGAAPTSRQLDGGDSIRSLGG